MSSPLTILYKPKSILGLLVAGGILFLMIAGLSLTVNKDVSQFFSNWGFSLLAIGLVGWALFFLPAALRNLSR